MEPEKTEENMILQDEGLSQNQQGQNVKIVKSIHFERVEPSDGGGKKKSKWWIAVLAALGGCGIGVIICLIFLNQSIEPDCQLSDMQLVEPEYVESHVVLIAFDDIEVERIVTTYDEYQLLLEDVYAQLEVDVAEYESGTDDVYDRREVLDEDDFVDKDFVAFVYSDGSCGDFNGVKSVSSTYSRVDVEINHSSSCGACSFEYSLVLVPIDKNEVSSDAEIVITEKSEEGDNGDRMYVVEKPIIYIYPERTTEVSVRLGNPEKILVSYPEYDNGWQVVAEPNGDLTEVDSGKKLYGLYWEGGDSALKVTDEGFVVPGEQTAEFLDEKLAILGLNDHEREEFIIYWLPKMQDNNYNYIRFATDTEIEAYMPLKVTPKPDTMIRVMMVTKPLENYKEVKEQTLTSKVRSGYTVVEWGGSVGSLDY